MKRFIRLVLSVAMLVAALAEAKAADAPIKNVDSQLVTRADGKPITAEQVKQAIVRTGAVRGWIFNPDREGHLLGKINVRNKHTATIDVTYNESAFSIKYVDSTNLNYRKDTEGQELIHNNYNRWVNNLRQDVVNAIRGMVD